jgi:hypothetical protein
MWYDESNQSYNKKNDHSVNCGQVDTHSLIGDWRYLICKEKIALTQFADRGAIFLLR